VGVTDVVENNNQISTFGFPENQDILLYIDINIGTTFTLDNFIAKKAGVNFSMFNYYSLENENYNSRIQFGIDEYFNDHIKVSMTIQSSLTPTKVSFDGMDAYLMFSF
jgi:hypothetical protein